MADLTNVLTCYMQILFVFFCFFFLHANIVTLLTAFRTVYILL